MSSGGDSRRSGWDVPQPRHGIRRTTRMRCRRSTLPHRYAPVAATGDGERGSGWGRRRPWRRTPLQGASPTAVARGACGGNRPPAGRSEPLPTASAGACQHRDQPTTGRPRRRVDGMAATRDTTCSRATGPRNYCVGRPRARRINAHPHRRRGREPDADRWEAMTMLSGVVSSWRHCLHVWLHVCPTALCALARTTQVRRTSRLRDTFVAA